MYVLVNGLPYFGKILVNDLNEFGSKRKCIFLNTYYSRWDKLLYFLLLPFSKVIISFNGVSDSSGTLNWALKWNKKIIMQWQGSDVMLAKERFEKHTILFDYIKRSNHVTDFEFLQKELKDIGIQASLLPYKHLDFQNINHSYSKISILSYVGNKNEDLYGLNEIIEAAKSLPDIEFHIIGTNMLDYLNVPANIFIHGWITKFEVTKLMLKCGIFLRMTKHDGNALSVAEALAMGCEVIWTYPSERTYLANTSIELVDKIKQVKTIIEQRNYKPNVYQSENILKKYNREIVISNYIKYVDSVL